MPELKEYDSNGRTVLLSDEDAQRAGLSGGKARSESYELPEQHRDTSQREDSVLSDGEVLSTQSTTKARRTANK